MRLDSSGNVLVGTTNANPAANNVTGHALKAGGLVEHANSGAMVMRLNRTDSDGSIIEFRKGTGVVGEVGVVNTNNLRIGGTVADHAGIQFGTNILIPESGGSAVDGSVDLGYASGRFKDLYLSGDVIAEQIQLYDSAGNDRQTLIFDASDNLQIATGTSTGSRGITFLTENTERMRLDASGNLLVGTTETDIGFTASGAGCMLGPEGTLQLARNSANELLYLNKLGGNAGDIIRLSTDGNEIGVLGVRANYLKIGNGDTQLLFNSGSDAITPEGASDNRDAAIDLGRTVSRFKDLHLSANCRSTSFVGTDDNDTLIRMGGSDVMQFFTANSERARLAASGHLLIGTTSFSSGGGGHLLAPTGARSSSRTITTLAYHNLFYNANGFVGGISTSGSATTYATSSDQRLKDNIVDAPSASDDIDAIQVRSFDWKADGSHQKYGMVAQELQSVAPEAVSEGETEDDMMGVDYSKLVPMLVKEIQSLRARVAQLETN
jgi:hypothetical protein